MIIADSDVLIDFLRGRGEGARRVAIELETRSLGTTAITAFEIRSGARTARQKKSVDTLLEALAILPFGPEEARIAVEIRQQVESQGNRSEWPTTRSPQCASPQTVSCSRVTGSTSSGSRISS